jgi:hypothetical protein
MSTSGSGDTIPVTILRPATLQLELPDEPDGIELDDGVELDDEIELELDGLDELEEKSVPVPVPVPGGGGGGGGVGPGIQLINPPQ